MGLQSAHGGSEYERLVHDGKLVLQLHGQSVMHHHGPLSDPRHPLGNGVLLWFEVYDLDKMIDRAAEIRAEIIRPKHRNPPVGDGGPNHWEIWLRDPDGYLVVLASPDGSAANGSAA
jgi:predicted enzyme related to lactoylglutathione lyase